MRFKTRVIHAGQTPDPTTGAIIPPVYQTSTYVQTGLGQNRGYEYSRPHHPTRNALENNVAALEGARHGIAFASGCAAATTLMHLFKPGDHIICSDDVYGGTFRLFKQAFEPMGLRFSFVDLTRPDALEQAREAQTVAVWLETPTNPLLKIIDLAHTSAYARQHDILTICDNTFATPVFQRPLEYGCDLVVHSTTKYLNGHSDVIGGMVCTSNDELAKRLHDLQSTLGAVPGPWDAWLVLRGIKTLCVRMQAHASQSLAVAEFLSTHPDVASVSHPALSSHPQHALAARQMDGFGGMVSCVLPGGLPQARAFLEALEVFSLATSLGGVESLASHPALMTHASMPAEIRDRLGLSDGLVRLSVGLEDIQDLLEDLTQALARSKDAASHERVLL